MVNINLIHGDCLEEMQKLIQDNVKVDLILTDLPYGVTANEWDNIIPFDEMWSKINQVIYDRTPILFFATQPFTSKLVMSKLNWFRYEWIYQKRVASNFGVAKYQPMKEHEEVLVFGRKSPNYYPIKEERKGGGANMVKYDFNVRTTSSNYNETLHKKPFKNQSELRYPGTVRLYNNRGRGNVGSHPNQKPVELLEYLIKTYSNENDLVLDFTMGSGSTGVACRNTNRNFIGIELDDEYFDIAKERVNNCQSKLV